MRFMVNLTTVNCNNINIKISDSKHYRNSVISSQLMRKSYLQTTPLASSRRQEDALSVISGQSSQRMRSTGNQKFLNTNVSVRRSQLFDASKYVCEELDAEQIIQLREVFNRWDQDQSGTLAPNELKLALMQYEKNISQTQINQLLGVVDIEEKGEIDFENFISIYKREVILKFINIMYSQYDIKKQGYITVQDLTQFTERKLKKKENEETLIKIIQTVGNGQQITKSQFTAVMLNHFKMLRNS
ncbi:ubiquitin carboxyl-terminal hydrolase (macronuclear) [Tetrahymena thermophila SB210]|uniref:Ubiquitin carboxyl-terminal hydrolase n=1 Tax=Tetrahymena thermophila (strain SB210) TaxID=312017 RepID=W7XH82_TETTS|nr:ubiquitin carboxyl-terminal hydrolase [Tetrahymena thermophila SB210]EWS72389.1 ubiquitin carboxyl-terminal hydrolase [Tetrahymena thermophila SB210]|eukprot:XP_012655073.1 ubiquitin carboxyl-terminal hydrolase [Tetrahymena thermophila SB210]